MVRATIITTPFIFLALSGVVMIVALTTSRKARGVIKTSVDLARQDAGDEMFGSSGLARSIVRASSSLAMGIENVMPQGLKRWLGKRFDKDEAILENGAAFDMVRAAVNLLLASLLIALGTSLKLPLSTTYVPLWWRWVLRWLTGPGAARAPYSALRV